MATFAELVAEERSTFERSPDWELAAVVKALTMFPWMNGPEQKARLQAVRAIQRQRRARRREES